MFRVQFPQCRIEDRRLAEAGNLQACLALDMVVAWRILNLTRLGRQTPDLPCTVTDHPNGATHDRPNGAT